MMAVDHGPVPDGYRTLDELIKPLEKSIAGREEWTRRDRGDPCEVVMAIAPPVRDVLSRAEWDLREFVVERLASALRRGQLQTVVWNSAAGRFERLPGRGWQQVGDFALAQAVRRGWLETSVSEAFAEYRYLYVLVSEEEIARFLGRDATPEGERASSRGRPRGTGQKRSDEPYVREIEALVAEGKFPSRTKAAWAIVDRCGPSISGNSPQQKVDRLVRQSRRP